MYVDTYTGVVYSSYLDQEETEKALKNYTKSQLLANGKFDIYKSLRFAEYSKFCALNYGTEINKKYEFFLGANVIFSDYEKKCCRQLYDSQRGRVLRLKSKLNYVLATYNCLWLTLTFNDDILSSTSHLTRRRYIQRFLKSLNVLFYVANVDYGDRDKNPESKGREHYHAIITSDYLDMSLYKYGYIFVERIKNNTNSISKISKYINKLTYHAFKDCTKNQDRLIYSRGDFMSLC